MDKEYDIDTNILVETMAVRDLRNKMDFEVCQRAFKKKHGRGRASGGI